MRSSNMLVMISMQLLILSYVLRGRAEVQVDLRYLGLGLIVATLSAVAGVFVWFMVQTWRDERASK